MKFQGLADMAGRARFLWSVNGLAELMNQHELTVADIAAATGISERHFYHVLEGATVYARTKTIKKVKEGLRRINLDASPIFILA